MGTSSFWSDRREIILCFNVFDSCKFNQDLKISSVSCGYWRTYRFFIFLFLQDSAYWLCSSSLFPRAAVIQFCFLKKKISLGWKNLTSSIKALLFGSSFCVLLHAFFCVRPLSCINPEHVFDLHCAFLCLIRRPPDKKLSFFIFVVLFWKVRQEIFV